MTDSNNVIKTIKANYDQMFSAEKKVADFILNNPEIAVNTNISELANLSGVSDATVIRMCKHAGYQGYYQMKISLSIDIGRNQVIGNTENGKPPNTINELFQIFIADFLDIAGALNIETVLKCVELIKQAQMVHIVAAGNTLPLAADLGFRLGRFGIRTTHNMVAEYFFNNINLAMPKDIVIALSRSGSSKQVVQALELAKSKGLKSITLTGHEYSPASRLSDHLLLTKPTTRAFHGYEPATHLNEMAVLDILLYFIANEDIIEPDNVELMLSEYKL